MWLIFLEAGIALCLLLLIVWSTWPKQKKPIPLRHPPEAPKQDKSSPQDPENEHEQR